MQMTGNGVERDTLKVFQAAVPQGYLRNRRGFEAERRMRFEPKDSRPDRVENEQRSGLRIDGHAHRIEKTEVSSVHPPERLGTGDAIVTRDRENDSLNMGTYRVMVHDRDHIFVYISPSKDGRIHRDKWFAKNEPMPVVAIFGADPLLHMVASWGLPHGQFEMEFAGGIKGEPIRVIKGPVTGLPIPADAEIVVEGFVMPDERKPEGPFGEWTGYYGSGAREEPVVQVKALYHRNDPVILGSPPVKPPSGKVYMQSILRSAAIYEQLDGAVIPGVKGVWFHEVGGGHMLNVISIQQLYPGHAKQAASILCQSRAGAYMGRYVIVVDEDINPRDLEDVMWAVCTRSDPAQDIDIIHRCLSGPLDPLISPEKKERRDFVTSRAIIDATRPFEWRSEFPRVSESSPELKEKVLAAHRGGIKIVILPKDNEKDLKDIPSSVLKDVKMILVDTMDEVLDIVLEEPVRKKDREEFMKSQRPPQIKEGDRPGVH